MIGHIRALREPMIRKYDSLSLPQSFARSSDSVTNSSPYDPNCAARIVAPAFTASNSQRAVRAGLEVNGSRGGGRIHFYAPIGQFVHYQPGE
jgi:hypothetical protein